MEANGGPMKQEPSFDLACRRCDRLSEFLVDVAREYPDYHSRPVAPFGAANPWLLIVGLAPGMHGANATGRPFTGDFAGILLYETLHEFGFSNQAQAIAKGDGLVLKDCKITNAVKCLPPQNKPTGAEINRCNPFLKAEILSLRVSSGIIALGCIAHKAVIKALGFKQKDYRFAHNARHDLDGGLWLLDSYHCSRYNTQTKRLTKQMFQDVFRQARSILGQAPR